MLLFVLTATASEIFPDDRSEGEVAAQSTSIVQAGPAKPFTTTARVDGLERTDHHWLVTSRLCGAEVPASVTVIPPDHAIYVAMHELFASTGEMESPIVPQLHDRVAPTAESAAEGALLYLRKTPSGWQYTVANAWTPKPTKKRLAELREQCAGGRMPPDPRISQQPAR